MPSTRSGATGAAVPARHARWRHEIPTHLDVQDKAFWGLSVRQVLYLTSGAAVSYGLWQQAVALPIGLRLGLAAGCLLLVAVVALVRPGGRGLEEWTFVALHRAAVPKAAVWRPRDPDLAAWRLPGGRGDGWEESPLRAASAGHAHEAHEREVAPWDC
jgi:hypothetical protein